MIKQQTVKTVQTKYRANRKCLFSLTFRDKEIIEIASYLQVLNKWRCDCIEKVYLNYSIFLTQLKLINKMYTTRTIKTTLVILLHFIFQISFGQSTESDSSKNIQIKLICSPTISSTNSPLLIITTDNKRFQIPEYGNWKDSTAIANTIGFLDPNWIKSINVLKDKDATEQFGTLGKNGVILIDLKKGSLKKFPSKIRKKFKDFEKI